MKKRLMILPTFADRAERAAWLTLWRSPYAANGLAHFCHVSCCGVARYYTEPMSIAG